MTTKIQKLKAQIDNNEQPLFLLCSGYIDSENTMSALIEMGYATKLYVTDRFGDIEDIEWFYCGPNPILVKCVHSDSTWVVQPDTQI